MSHKVSWDDGASYEDVVEAVRRVFVRDGIPRHVSADGTIKKYDWELTPEMIDDILERGSIYQDGMVLDGIYYEYGSVSLEQHIERLLEQAKDGQQG